MRFATATDQCPHWCVRDHSAELRGSAFYHASETCSVTISMPRRPGLPERVDVETAQYWPDDPDEEAWTPTVEVALYAGSRYRLIGLTPQEARQLAAVLAHAADMPGVATGSDSHDR
ncbi:MAG TPA: hypothetical protein VII22_08175 [Streptosporangiaceae bacterium]